MKQIRVFIASSTEGQSVATQLRTALQEELGRSGRVDIWLHKFAPGQAAIESLDAVANEADFALVVMTGDDKTLSRNVTMSAPRDNLIFELGMFLGALGRDRSFVVRDRHLDLKIPTDYSGVNAIMLDAQSGAELEESIHRECIRLAERIRCLGSRSMWLRAGRLAICRSEFFANQIQGMWWQRINHSEGSVLSSMVIAVNPETASVTFEGTGYACDGAFSARWTSTMVHLESSERGLKYVWRGVHPLPNQVNLKYHGFGELVFDAPDQSTLTFTRGTGMFWDVNEAVPSHTMAKPVELRRIADERQQHILTLGTAAERRDLVAQIVSEWPM